MVHVLLSHCGFFFFWLQIVSLFKACRNTIQGEEVGYCTRQEVELDELYSE